MRKHQAMEKSGKGELPEELLIDILLRLPVKPLIRFASVHKSWFSTIKSAEFAAKHFAVRSDFLKDGFDFLLVAHHRNSIPTFSLLPYENPDKVSCSFECKPFPYDREQSEPAPVFRFAGPCHGIFCVMVQTKFRGEALLLWNPATREMKTIEVDACVHNFGIGFDPKTNDYKVVVVAWFALQRSGHWTVRVYSLRANSWRSIHNRGFFKWRFFNQNANFFRNGSRDFDVVGMPSWNGRMFNWLGRGPCCSPKRFLITFDMSDEVFLETPLPQGCGYGHYLVEQQSHTPRVFGFSSASCDTIDVWSLNEYGKNGSWAKQGSVRLPNCVKNDSPLVLWKTDAVLFRHGKELAAYSLDHTEQVVPTGVEEWNSAFGLGYTQSLISIKGENQQLEEQQQRVGNDADCIKNDKVPAVYSFGEVNQRTNLFLFQLVQPEEKHSEVGSDEPSSSEEDEDDDEGSEEEEDGDEGGEEEDDEELSDQE
ncbi:hypothetical protein Ancab_013448 [Ancistrocladus abbreviatus]